MHRDFPQFNTVSSHSRPLPALHRTKDRARYVQVSRVTHFISVNNKRRLDPFIRSIEFGAPRLFINLEIRPVLPASGTAVRRKRKEERGERGSTTGRGRGISSGAS